MSSSRLLTLLLLPAAKPLFEKAGLPEVVARGRKRREPGSSRVPRKVVVKKERVMLKKEYSTSEAQRLNAYAKDHDTWADIYAAFPEYSKVTTRRMLNILMKSGTWAPSGDEIKKPRRVKAKLEGQEAPEEEEEEEEDE